jgi:hypothetical protein
MHLSDWFAGFGRRSEIRDGLGGNPSAAGPSGRTSLDISARRPARWAAAVRLRAESVHWPGRARFARMHGQRVPATICDCDTEGLVRGSKPVDGSSDCRAAAGGADPRRAPGGAHDEAGAGAHGESRPGARPDQSCRLRPAPRPPAARWVGGRCAGAGAGWWTTPRSPAAAVDGSCGGWRGDRHVGWAAGMMMPALGAGPPNRGSWRQAWPPAAGAVRSVRRSPGRSVLRISSEGVRYNEAESLCAFACRTAMANAVIAAAGDV